MISIRENMLKLATVCSFICCCVVNAHEGHEHLKKLAPRTLLKSTTGKQGQITIKLASSKLVDGDITVKLIGIPHLASESYASGLKDQLLNKGPILVEGLLKASLEAKPSLEIKPLIELQKKYQNSAAKFNLQLVDTVLVFKGRKVKIADISLKNFGALPNEQRQSVLLDVPDDKKSLKRLLGEFDEVPYFIGASSIHSLRDDVLIAEMHHQLIRGKKNITMIVSAARMPGLEVRLQKQRFMIKATKWHAVWVYPASPPSVGK